MNAKGLKLWTAKAGRRSLLAIAIISLLIAIYFLFIMPLPFSSDRWLDRSLRPRMVDTVEEMVIGLSRADIIELLGSPQPNTDGIIHAPSRAIAYMIRDRGFRHDFLIIFFDEDNIAIDARVMRV